MDILKDLNEQQRAAVTAPLGPVLVLAGAGSGKTRALTYRIAYLIDSGQFDPSQILAVTFTNKAANEMKERVDKLINTSNNSKYKVPTVGTFHSICARLLRREINHLPPYNSQFTIFDSDDSLRAIRQILKNMDLTDKDLSPTYVRSVISSLKNQMVNIDMLEDDRLIDIYKSYEKMLRELNALDFDDLLVTTVLLFKSHPRILARYQQFWPYVLVDEYQDTNNLQYELIKNLVAKNQNIFAVGDDAQSIYGFRGANYRNILNFEKDFPQSFVFTLDENYRSTQVILSAANEVIKLSPKQKKKNLWTQNGEGSKIVVYTAADEVGESVFVAEQIAHHAKRDGEIEDKSYELSEEPEYVSEEEPNTDFFDRLLSMNEGYRPFRPTRSFDTDDLDFDELKKIAVLYRTNAQSRALEEVFLQFGIPYNIIGSVRFYERKEIKDLLSFLRLLQNPSDFLSLSRVISVPPRGIGEKSLQYIQKGEINALTAKAAQAWQRFQTTLKSIRNTPAEAKLLDIIDIVTKKFDLKDYYVDGSPEGEDRWDNIKELMTVAGRFSHLPWEQALSEFLAEVALYSDTDEIGEKPGVTLMTLHQAKGLEFDIVFMVGMEEGLLPHTRSLEPGGDVHEEVRLAYVGITRARKHLYLTHTHSRRLWGSSMSLRPSRILKAIPEELIEQKESW